MTEIPSDRTRLVERLIELWKERANRYADENDEAMHMVASNLDRCIKELRVAVAAALLSQGEATAPMQPKETAQERVGTTVLRQPKGVHAAVTHVMSSIRHRMDYWQSLPDEPPRADTKPSTKECVVANLDFALAMMDDIVWELEQVALPLPPAPTDEPSR